VPSRALRPGQERTAKDVCHAHRGCQGSGGRVPEGGPQLAAGADAQAPAKPAAKRGLNPNVWFNHVELIAAEKIGRETVTYVSNIYKYYLAYRMVEEERAERMKAKEAVKQGAGK
jgi:hypothetical protein